ncbi:hypothetical protein [Sphingomonas jatrophae]|uniref:Uncharacterized protein n=1 Tax=Sphingomonas jatrophae TaxID=1166337 RepID=A0A1I6JH62_9SPHN|nr:hypothetical protein [Sphingomonas jatrophae]SFR78199.1 hypothetical protein SAMN05192580_0256 [Sphingomonas jatrophae]
MTDPERSFGFAGRYLLLLIIAALVALLAVAIYGAREAPEAKRGELGPLSDDPSRKDAAPPVAR